MTRLTPRQRGELRDVIARTALRRGLRNPLVTKEERQAEALDVLPLIVETYNDDPDNWGEQSRVFSVQQKTRILEREEVAA